jgi:TDG/mug DNA glycosylase family protein
VTLPRIVGFAPISTADAKILILGSMPSVASLAAREYYAHKDNAFWRIMGELFGAGWDKPYRERVRILRDNGIAVWDVLQSCIRPGSLDSNIRDAQPNDFQEFFARHPQIGKVGLNGGKAAESFGKFAGAVVASHVSVVRLPSTSRANARLRYEAKLDVWRAFLVS